MSANTLNIVSSFIQHKVALHGDMAVAFDTPLPDNFIISFFSSTNEVFELKSALYKFRDFAGNLVDTIVFGGRHGLFIELTLDQVNGVLYPTANNVVAIGGDRNPIRAKEIIAGDAIEPMDGSQADVFNILLTNTTALTLSPIRNPAQNFKYYLYIQQDGAGNRSLSLHSKYKFPGGRAPNLSKLPGTIDIIEATARENGIFLCTAIIGYSTTPVAAVDNINYDTMAPAIAAVPNDGTVWILRTANLQEALATNTVDKSFAIAGTPGLMPTLATDETLRLSYGKAIINPEYGEVYFRDLQMTGAADPAAGNGAAVRCNPGTRYLQFDNVKFHTNENGILTSTLSTANQTPKDIFTIVLQDSEFNNNGHSTNHKGRTHNVYMGIDHRVFALRCRFTNSEFGHDYKSRGKQNLIDRCVLSGSKSGRALDIPNGGIVHVSNSYLRKPSGADQSNLIGIGQETVPTDREEQYIFRNCLLENLKSNNYQLSFINQANSTTKIYFVDCVFLGNPESVFNVCNAEYIYTGGHLGPEDYFGPTGFIPKVAAQSTSNYIALPTQPAPIYGPDPTLEWFPPTNSPSVNPATPNPAPVLVRTSSSRNYPGTNSGAGGGIAPPPPPDITPPAISVSTTASQITTRGPLTINAIANDNVEVKKVEFYKNGKLLTTVTTVPYSVIDYITSEDNGTLDYTAKAFDTSDNSTTSSTVTVGVEITELPVSELHPFSIDDLTLAEYKAAIEAAVVNTKREAAAQAIINAFKPDYRLYIYSGNDLVVPIEFTGAMTIANDGTHVYVKTSLPDFSFPVKSGNLTATVWRFELQGGENYSRKIIGSVGDPASGALLTLSENPEVGSGSIVNFSLQLPAGLDVAV